MSYPFSDEKKMGGSAALNPPSQHSLSPESYLDIQKPVNRDPRTGYRGRLYPNGEFSLGAVPRDKVRAVDAKYDSLMAAELDWRSPVGWSEEDGRIQKSLDYNYHFDWDGYQALVNPVPPVVEESPIGLSDVVISHELPEGEVKPLEPKPRAARGSKGLSTRGRRQIRNGCYLLRQKYHGRLGFLTLTLPSFPYREDAMSFLILEWSSILKHFLLKFSRLAKKLGFPPLYVGCVEIQEKRFDSFGHPCPHAHIVYVCRKKSVGNDFYVNASQFRCIWREVIENKLKSLSSDCPIDFQDGATIDCVVLKKDPSRYISKYLTKGRNPVEKVKEAGLGSFLPSGWTICCLALKETIVSLTTDIPYDWKIAIIEQIPLVSRGICIYLYKIEGEGFSAGYSGQFAQGTPVELNPL